MRITPTQHQTIKKIVTEIAGKKASVILFGSRIDDNKRGGDVDLLVELPNVVDSPAWLIARLSARISRSMEGRQVDILLTSPNLLKFPIHEHAKSTGIRL